MRQTALLEEGARETLDLFHNTRSMFGASSKRNFCLSSDPFGRTNIFLGYANRARGVGGGSPGALDRLLPIRHSACESSRRTYVRGEALGAVESFRLHAGGS